jgi:hypothetical protein
LDLRGTLEAHEHVRASVCRRAEHLSFEKAQVEQVQHPWRQGGHEPSPQRKVGSSLCVAQRVLDEPGLDAVAHEQLGTGLALCAGRQALFSAGWNVLAGGVVDQNVTETLKWAAECQPSCLCNGVDEVAQRLAKECRSRGLFEPVLEGAGVDEPEAANEVSSQGREAKRMPFEKRLDNDEQEAKRGALALSWIVAGLGPQSVDNARGECLGDRILNSQVLGLFDFLFWTGHNWPGMLSVHGSPW